MFASGPAVMTSEHPFSAWLQRLLGPEPMADVVGECLTWSRSMLGACAVGLVERPGSTNMALGHLYAWGFAPGDCLGDWSMAGRLESRLDALLPTGTQQAVLPNAPVDSSTAPGSGTIVLTALTGRRAHDVVLAVALEEREPSPDELTRMRDLGLLLSTAIDHALAHEAVHRRSGMDQLLMEMSTALIHVPADQLEKATSDALAAVGRFIGAEHGHVLIEGDDRVATTIHWSVPGLADLDPAIVGCAASDTWHARLAEGRACLPARELAGCATSAQPSDGSLTGALLLPMRAEGRLVGRVLFSTSSPWGVAWDEPLATSLQPLGQMIAQLLTSHRHSLQLAASEARHRSIVENVHDVIVRLDATGKVSFVNRAWTELSGESVEDTLARADPFDRVHPEDRAMAGAHIAAVVAGEDPGSRSVRFQAADGSYRWMEVRGHATFDADGAFEGLSGVLHDVTDRKLSEERVRQALKDAVIARDEAERSSRTKSQFLSRMSHELRTPLNAILGFAQLLEYSPLSTDDADSVRLIRRAGEHLLALINDVMDLSRIQSGELELERESVPLHEVWAESVEWLAASAADMDVRVEAWTGPEVRVHTDRRRLRQVVLNLLSNAIKYNRPGGRVHVSARAEGTEAPQVVLEVSDTGKGMREDQLAELFVPFNRLGAEVTAVEGTGIGLALVKSFVEAMDGAIEASSEPGVGTTFAVTLPAPAASSSEETSGTASAVPAQ